LEPEDDDDPDPDPEDWDGNKIGVDVGSTEEADWAGSYWSRFPPVNETDPPRPCFLAFLSCFRKWAVASS